MDRLAELKKRFLEEPLAKAAGISLGELGDGRAILTQAVRDDQLIVGGAVQGGVTTVLADYAGVYAAMTRIPQGHTPAHNISITFLRPILAGELMLAEADVSGETRGSVTVSVQVFGNGKLKAVASILFAKPKS